MEMNVSTDIVEYVEREIMPRYENFDKAHRQDHIRSVISRSLELAKLMPQVDPDMVYTVASFHDLGLVNGREMHHRDSRLILESDSWIKGRFTAEQIRLMGEAVEDHRASNSRHPRSDYGLIVAEADRLIEPETIIRRTIQYGLSHYPELDREGHYSRTLQHLNEKYGPEGYLRVWILWSDNARRLKELHALIADTQTLRSIFDRLFDAETESQGSK